jgi:hypothetical protein
LVWTKNVGTAYHQQDTDYYCGAATAQMILDQIGAGILDQTTLYNSNHSHNTHTGWATDPNGLAYTLRHFRPASFTNTFVVYAMPNEPQGSEKIVYTLWKYGVATGTLVFQSMTGGECAHWIAVRGVSTSVEPKPGSTYSINGFWINNPWPPVPAFIDGYDPTLLPPPPHTAGDGCGSGGNRGNANEYVAYATGVNSWQNTYLTGCNWCGSLNFISVCDPEPPKLGKLDMRRPEFWAKGDRLIGPEAMRFAQRGIDEHSLLEDKLFQEALEGTEPSDPILVQRLDLPDSYYYLVPMLRKDEVTAMISIDGLYGNFGGARVYPKPVRRPFVDRGKVFEELIGQKIELGDRRGKLILRKKAHCFYPIMVWRPCKESRSPYHPFYMITVGDNRIYIGYDGTIHSELHGIGLGG